MTWKKLVDNKVLLLLAIAVLVALGLLGLNFGSVLRVLRKKISRRAVDSTPPVPEVDVTNTTVDSTDSTKPVEEVLTQDEETGDAVTEHVDFFSAFVNQGKKNDPEVTEPS